MFDFIRTHSKIVMGLLFLLIIPSFVLFGVERYSQGDGQGEKVATVDGQAITRPEWDAQHRIESDRIRQQMPNVEPALLDSDAARYATLERMVRDRVLAAAAAKANMSVSEERLARLFGEDAGLAAFRDASGKFDRERFIRTTGQTPEQYEAGVRSQLATQQVLLGISGTAFVPKAQGDVALNAFYDQREIQVARFNAADFAGKVQLGDADLETYYKAHAAQFQAPEEASIEYVVLDLDTVKKGIPVSEADLKSYYEQNAARFGTKEERRASHILIAAPAGAPAKEREQARAKAEQLLAELKKAPAEFAELARKNSQDPGSAASGGDLDYVTRGAMVKPFDDALFALKKGEISGIVETEFGYHIIRLDDIRPAVTPPLEKVRATVENEIRSQQATQEFAKAAEAFTDLVYQQPDSLKPAADRFKLAIQTASHVARTPAAGAKGVLGSRNFLSALFAPDALERKHNTEAIEIAPNQLAAGRIVQHSPARTLPLAEVKDAVRAQLVAERAAALAKAEGEARLAAWRSDSAGAGAIAIAPFGAPVTVSRLETHALPAPVIDGALRADTARLPALEGVDLGSAGYAVVRVNKTVPRTPPTPEVARQESAQLAQAMAAAESLAYYDLLKERFKARILVRRPVQEMG